MRWNDLFADLEAQLQFEQWQTVEQDAAELTRGAWAEITLMDRLRAAIGEQIGLTFSDGRRYLVTIHTVGPTWVGGVDETGALLIPRASIAAVDAALRRARVPVKSFQAGPSLAGVYRALARRREPLQIVARQAGIVAEGTIDRVGKDHLDLSMHARHEFRREDALLGRRIIPFEIIEFVRASPWGFTDL